MSAITSTNGNSTTKPMKNTKANGEEREQKSRATGREGARTLGGSRLELWAGGQGAMRRREEEQGQHKERRWRRMERD